MRAASDRFNVPSQHQKPYAEERVDMIIDHPPDNWMKVMAIDPGTHRSGFLCAAVPPPPPTVKVEDYRPNRLMIYAEAMLYNANACRMAELAQKLIGGWVFEVIIIDQKGSDPRPPGFTMRVREQYEAEFKRKGIYTRRGGEHFFLGTPNTAARELRMKELIHADILKINSANCPNLVRQMKDFYRKKDDLTKREEKKKKPLELVDAAEYIAGYFDGMLYYHPPQPAPAPEDTVQSRVERLMKVAERTGWQPFSTKRDGSVPIEDFLRLDKPAGMP